MSGLHLLVPSQVSPRRPVLRYSVANPVTPRLALLASLGSANDESEGTTAHSRELCHQQFRLRTVTVNEQRVKSSQEMAPAGWTDLGPRRIAGELQPA